MQVAAFAQKDPDEAANADPEGLKVALEGGKDYIESVLEELAQGDVQSAQGKREALSRFLPLLQAVTGAVERGHYLAKAAATFGTTEVALQEDLDALTQAPVAKATETKEPQGQAADPESFTKGEIVLGLALCYPQLSGILDQLIEPPEGFERELLQAIKDAPETNWTLEMLTLSELSRERASILQMFCEHHNMDTWSEHIASMELKKNCRSANQDLLKRKKREIALQLAEARKQGSTADLQKLSTQYQQVIKLSQMAK